MDNSHEQKPQPSQSERLSLLLTLEHEVRELNNVKDFGFFVVNETHQLFPYKNAILWKKLPGLSPRATTVSGVTHSDSNTPFIQWTNKTLRYCVKQSNMNAMRTIDKNQLPQDIQNIWPEGIGDFLLWAPFVYKGFTTSGGMLFVRTAAWDEPTQKQFKWLIHAYSYSWYFMCQPRGIKKWLENQSKNKWRWIGGIVAALIIICLIPVRISVIAPAEVIAKNPAVITSPAQGVIEKITVKPNELVKKGQVLFTLDQTELMNQKRRALQELAVLQEEYNKVVHNSYEDPDARAQISILRSKLDEKHLAVNYASALLAKSQVEAPINGTVIFNHVNDWQGKPVTPGEKVMLIAQPNKAEIKVNLPVTDAIQINKDAEVKLYINGDPLNPISGKVQYISYDAQLTPEQFLAYRVIADINEKQQIPRVGAQGSAKIYGDRVILIYYLFRRPAAFVRQKTGW
jgi:multidrug resistance efflux pump